VLGGYNQEKPGEAGLRAEPVCSRENSSAILAEKEWVRLTPNPLTHYQITNSLSDTHLRGDTFSHKGLNHITLLYVIEVLEVDAALHAVADFAGIVFKALE
jgi:hypothetical protein